MHDANAQGQDRFLCDFCGSRWTDDLPMVEGHRGSLICARCLRVAYTEVVLLASGQPSPEACTMCLEARPDERAWISPGRGEARICRRCANQSARVLAKDQGPAWPLPTRDAPGSSSRAGA